jgi:hypothetical protein
MISTLGDEGSSNGLSKGLEKGSGLANKELRLRNVVKKQNCWRGMKKRYQKRCPAIK